MIAAVVPLMLQVMATILMIQLQSFQRLFLVVAAAASLALIPIAREVFWGPMAYAMMGGIIVGTAHAAVPSGPLCRLFRIKAPEVLTEEVNSGEPTHAGQVSH